VIPRVGFQEKRANKTDQQDGRKYARAEYKMLIITSWPISGTSATPVPGEIYLHPFLPRADPVGTVFFKAGKAVT
jgi:hypothetical protein